MKYGGKELSGENLIFGGVLMQVKATMGFWQGIFSGGGGENKFLIAFFKFHVKSHNFVILLDIQVHANVCYALFSIHVFVNHLEGGWIGDG